MEKDGEWIWTNKWEISSRTHPSATTLLLCPDEILCVQQKDHPNSHQLCWWQFSDLPTWNLKQEDYQCTHMRQESEEEREAKNKQIICITFYCQVPISDTQYGNLVIIASFLHYSVHFCLLFVLFICLTSASHCSCMEFFTWWGDPAWSGSMLVLSLLCCCSFYWPGLLGKEVPRSTQANPVCSTHRPFVPSV